MPLIVGVVAVMIYTLVVGMGLLGGSIPASRGNLLLAVPCLAPTLWYFLGFLLYDSGDSGLVLSGVGWASVGLGFFLQHQHVLAALAADPTALATGMGLSAAAQILFAVGFILLLTGAVLSWVSLTRRVQRTVS